MMVKMGSGIVLSVCVCLLLGGCDRPKAKGMEPPASGPVPVSVISPTITDAPMKLEVTGQTQGSNAAQVYARVGGYLQKIHYPEGGYVKEGALLFTIDPSDLLNARDSAQAVWMQTKANHDNAVTILERTRPLAAAHAASQQELDTAIANEKTTAALFAAAKASLSQAVLNLSYAQVRAPLSGYTDKRKVDLGTFISPTANGLLTTVYQTDPLFVTFSLSEAQKISYQNAIASGKIVAPKGGDYEIELSLADGSVVNRKGSINFVAPFIDPATGTASYRATISNGDGKLLPGQFVRVVVKGLQWKGALTLPQKAVLTGEKGKFVYVVEANNTVTPKPVQIGDWSGENVVIAGGLQGDEKIAVDGLTKLRPSSPVIPHGLK